MKEKYKFLNAVIRSALLVLYRKINFFENLFSITVKCSFKVRSSSINTSKYLIKVIRFISLSLVNNDRSLNGIPSFSRALCQSVYLFLSLYRDSLFKLNHLKTLLNSRLAVLKTFFITLCEKKVCMILKHYELKCFRYIT